MYVEKDSQIIAQGAEAIVKKVDFLGKVCVLKRRLVKAFRHPTLDETLTRGRMVAECRSTAKLRKHGVYAPVIYLVDFARRETLYEFVPGETVHALLARGRFEQLDVVGDTIARMHNANIVHGDLTTKNMIVPEGRAICMIDFGLSFFSTLAEVRFGNAQDKAVDLYVLERCLAPDQVPVPDPQFQSVLDAYLGAVSDPDDVLRKLEEVRLRGRKRDLSG